MSKESQIEQRDPIAIVFTFRPNFSDTLATVTLVTGTGTRCRHDVFWRGRVGLTRGSLAGLDRRECALLLGDALHAEWAGARDHREAPAHDPAVGPGAPLGAAGGTVTQDPLPGL
jgi:hypothetical protein